MQYQNGEQTKTYNNTTLEHLRQTLLDPGRSNLSSSPIVIAIASVCSRHFASVSMGMFLKDKIYDYVFPSVRRLENVYGSRICCNPTIVLWKPTFPPRFLNHLFESMVRNSNGRRCGAAAKWRTCFKFKNLLSIGGLGIERQL
jgi:hypothetical protein